MRKISSNIIHFAVLSTITWGGLVATSLAQNCPCGNSMQGVMYESAMGPAEGMPGPEALLETVDNPTEIINLTIVVPEKALIIVNKEPTFTTGTVRNYIVRGLKAGKTYKFEVEGILKNEFGAVYVAKEEVKVAAGASQQVVLHLRRKNRPILPDAPAIPPIAPPAVPPAR
jgi:uncharacterized protein (TIGR03000 family)